MEIATVGILMPSPDGLFWTLSYSGCAHTQQFARESGQDAERWAVREVRRYYATCLTCQLERRPLPAEKDFEPLMPDDLKVPGRRFF
jgi:hypothetical protein